MQGYENYYLFFSFLLKLEFAYVFFQMNNLLLVVSKLNILIQDVLHLRKYKCFFKLQFKAKHGSHRSHLNGLYSVSMTIQRSI